VISGPSGTLTPAISRLPAASCLPLTVSTFIGVLLFFAAEVSLIRLATPTSDDARLQTVVRRTSGFVYYVSVAGVTGVKEADEQAVAPAVARVRRASGLPVAVGFGIKTPERAAAIARVADAAVVGSALVEEVAQALAAEEPAAPRVLAKVRELAEAVRRARAPIAEGAR